MNMLVFINVINDLLIFTTGKIFPMWSRVPLNRRRNIQPGHTIHKQLI